MASIYEKALKRRDYSGVVKGEGEGGKGGAAGASGAGATGATGAAGAAGGKSPGGKKDGTGKDDPKAGADIGKIVNLMASDSTRVRVFISLCVW